MNTLDSCNCNFRIHSISKTLKIIMHEWMKIIKEIYIQLPGFFHTILTLGGLAYHSRTLLAVDDSEAPLKSFRTFSIGSFEAGIQESLSSLNSLSFLFN